MSDNCANCGKKVYAMEMSKAMGKSYHKACLKCAKCKKTLGNGNFNDNGKDIYCDRCYMAEFVDNDTKALVESMENNYNKKQAFGASKALPGLSSGKPNTFKPSAGPSNTTPSPIAPPPAAPVKRMNASLQSGIIQGAQKHPAVTKSSTPAVTSSSTLSAPKSSTSSFPKSSTSSAPKSSTPSFPKSSTSSAPFGKSAAATSGAKFCSSCGNPRSGNFCQKCGKKF